MTGTLFFVILVVGLGFILFDPDNDDWGHRR